MYRNRAGCTQTRSRNIRVGMTREWTRRCGGALLDPPSCWIIQSEPGATTEDDGLEYFFEWYGPYHGTKLFGHPAWIQAPETPTCNSCAERTQLLLSIQSYEPWRHDKRHRQPSGLRHATPGGTTALMIGDAGCAYIFICRKCPELPIVALMQGS